MMHIVMMILSVSLWIVLTLPGVSAPLQVITLQQPPLEYEENGVIKGIAVNLVSEIFARMQQPITLNLFPFARSLNMLKESEADAIFAIVKKPEREEFLTYPSEVLIEQTGTLFVQKDAPIHFNGDFQTLSAYQFGVLRAATYGPKWDEAIKTGIIWKVEDVDNYRQNVLKLINDRIDIMIGPRLSMLYVIKELDCQNAVRELSPPIEVVPTYLAFSKTRIAPEMIKEFSHILKALKADGTYDKIIRAYIE